MGVSNMQGTPWHIEYIKTENKYRKRRSKRRYFVKPKVCILDKNSYCPGSSLCSKCEEKNQKTIQKKSLDTKNMKVYKIGSNMESESCKEKKLKIDTKFIVKDLETQENEICRIAEQEKVDVLNGLISKDSPLALEVAKSKVGDTISVKNGDITIKYKILSIENK